jgi:hypothetical protein
LLWHEISAVERYLHQPFSEVAEMTLQELRNHYLCAAHWRCTEAIGAGSEDA